MYKYVKYATMVYCDSKVVFYWIVTQRLQWRLFLRGVCPPSLQFVGAFSSTIRDWVVRINHLYKESNSVADSLAALTYSKALGLYVLQSPPPPICSLLLLRDLVVGPTVCSVQVVQSLGFCPTPSNKKIGLNLNYFEIK